MKNDYYEEMKTKEYDGKPVETPALKKIDADPLMPPLDSVQD